MMQKIVKDKTICVVGLGYVGSPLAEAFSHYIPTYGYDIDPGKVDSLLSVGSKVRASTDPQVISEADVVMICVPTPVTKAKDPDLKPVQSAARTVGKYMKKGSVIVLESTVYPGVTEEIVVPILEFESGLTCGTDFFVGYSPERINPNDDDHTLDKITKIVSGMDKKTTDALCDLYDLVTTVYRAPDIKTAEAAKVIENIQRDLNIALMNELSIIFSKIGLDTQEVLNAAGTKWNFHPYRPGLVGGHCIPVDPYYLVMKAKEVGYHPQVILAGRSINDSMPKHIAHMAIKGLNESGKVIKGSKVLIMGLTYKEDVPDTRESPVEEIIQELKEFKVDVYGYDPLLSGAVIKKFGACHLPELDKRMDAIILAVAHKEFIEKPLSWFIKLMNHHPVFVDVRGVFDRCSAVEAGVYYQKL